MQQYNTLANYMNIRKPKKSNPLIQHCELSWLANVKSTI
jgi:hypothetical protein